MRMTSDMLKSFEDDTRLVWWLAVWVSWELELRLEAEEEARWEHEWRRSFPVAVRLPVAFTSCMPAPRWNAAGRVF